MSLTSPSPRPRRVPRGDFNGPYSLVDAQGRFIETLKETEHYVALPLKRLRVLSALSLLKRTEVTDDPQDRRGGAQDRGSDRRPEAHQVRGLARVPESPTGDGRISA